MLVPALGFKASQVLRGMGQGGNHIFGRSRVADKYTTQC